MIGAEAGEVMAAVQTAMLADLPYPRLRDAILAHPTMAEGLGSLFANVPPHSRRGCSALPGQRQKEITMTSKLAGKIAVVTGGSAGIGLGIAKHFAGEGARVFITGRHQSELDKAVAAIGGNAAAIQGDTTNLADLDRIYATVKAQAGRIDVLAANAGVYEFAHARGDHRGAFRQDIQHERARPVVRRAEGAAAADQRLVGDPHRLDGVDQGLRRLLGVQRDKGRDTLVRPRLDRRSQGARHPGQRVEPGIHRRPPALPSL